LLLPKLFVAITITLEGVGGLMGSTRNRKKHKEKVESGPLEPIGKKS